MRKIHPAIHGITTVAAMSALCMMAAPQFNMGLLDMSIDDIEDLPGFECPQNGVYVLKFSTAVKVVKMKSGEQDCVEANFEVLECLEQNDPEVDSTKIGTKFSMLFQLGNNVAISKMKELLIPFAEHFNERDLQKLVVDVLKSDTVITASVKRRQDKDDEDKFYPMLSNVVVA
jgi:hypothetical protein